MDNKNKRNFLKREGFYVILFVCLCVIATVAVITTKNNKYTKNIESKQQREQENQLQKEKDKVAQEPSVDYNNALQVKEDNKKEITVPKEGDKTAKVSVSSDMNFEKPVEGKIAREYSEDPVYWKSTNSYRSNLGIDIKCDLGKTVVSTMDGKVEKVNKNTQDGVQVIINHPNGIKTIYSNLDKKLKISEGQTIKKGDVIGVVGKTTLRAAYEEYGDHLHFAVFKDNNFVNPQKYIKY